jgi:hypothetical protein
MSLADQSSVANDSTLARRDLLQGINLTVQVQEGLRTECSELSVSP